MKSKDEFLNENASKRTKCLIYSRCMGYYRPVKYFNAGKQSEFCERIFYRFNKEIFK